MGHENLTKVTEKDAFRLKDHLTLGRELDLFLAIPEAALGAVFWLPDGVTLRQTLVDHLRRSNRQGGYREISTPPVPRQQVFDTSGHTAHYANRMFRVSSGDNGEPVGYFKPMNCPEAMILFGHQPRSYRELPLRWAQFDLLARSEQDGEVRGLLRTQWFTQDDAHLFITDGQIGEEITAILDRIRLVYASVGLPYSLRLSLGNADDVKSTPWIRAEEALREVLSTRDERYSVQSGEAAFYGPKIDVIVQSSPRTWQAGTVQLDFMLPENFDLSYVGPDGLNHRPVVIHRAMLGSLERFIALLLEHSQGAIPTWLSPIQVALLPINTANTSYSARVTSQLEERGVRVTEVNPDDGSLNSRIRKAAGKRPPYIAVVGRNEESEEAVSIRVRGMDESVCLPVSAFVDHVFNDINNKRTAPTKPETG